MPTQIKLLYRLFFVKRLIYRCVLMWFSFAVNAENALPNSLIAALSDEDLNSRMGLNRYGLNVGGWASSGINYNTNNPPHHSNAPMSMTDHSNEYNLYQLDLFVEKAVVKSNNWDVGGRFDFLYGTDSYYTQATGHWDTGMISKKDQYNLAFPQAYIELFSPIGNGLTAKLGHFYSIIGYESIPSPLNFFSSHTYSFKSSPFTSTGALFNYELNRQWSINLGAVTGADNFDRSLGAWSQMNGLNWHNSETNTSVSFSLLQGDVYDSARSQLVYYSAILQQGFGKWLYVLQHDRGTQDHAVNRQTAAWYSIVHYLTYSLNERFSLGVRGEWFRDQNGFRYAGGEASYYAVTTGLNWKPSRWLVVRPEARYDWCDGQTPAYSSGRRFDQVVIGLDAVVQF